MNVLIILSLALYGVAAIPINTTNNNQKIIGGMDARAGQFPYQALILFSENVESSCGGSIISNEWILTSALCIENANQDTAKIVVGSININSGGITYTVRSTIKHPDFKVGSVGYDIGAVRVNGRFNYNDFVQPITLFGGSTPVDLPLTISGWGGVSLYKWIIPNILQYTTIKSISLDECKQKLSEFPIVQVTNRELCTSSNDGKAMCIFDQGSPVVYNGEQHGIVSVPSTCSNLYPDIHTRIAPFKSWIKSVTNV